MQQVTKQCNLCNFPCKHNVGSYVGKNARILFLLESPTYQADVENRITAGPVMTLFKQYLQNAGISVDDIAITYMVHCYPGTTQSDQKYKLANNPVLKKFTDNCKPFFDKLLAEIKPELVVTVGARPTKYFLGDVRAKLFDVYGAIVESPIYHCKSYAMLDMAQLFMKTEYREYGIKSFEFIKKFLDNNLDKMPEMNLTLADTEAKANLALERLLKARRAAIDIETTGLNFLTDKIMGIGFSLSKDEAYYLPIHKYNADTDEVLPFWSDKFEQSVKEDLVKFFTNNVLKIAFNGQFDFKFIRKYLGINRINNMNFDAMLASHILNENLNGMRTLKLLSILFTDMGGYESTLYNWLREAKLTHGEMYKAPISLLSTYCMYDTIATYKLYELFDKQLHDQKLYTLFSNITMPLQNVLIDTEYYGVQVDIKHLNDLENGNVEYLENMLSVIRGKIGNPDFNANSTKQLADLLYTQLKCPITKMTAKGSPVTDKYVLEKYAKKFSVIQDILDYKKKRTETSTFLTGARKVLDSENKVHTSYFLHGTTSGRLSSRNINLQNVARNKDIKDLYIAEPGKVLIQCDLSQGEFNAWASYSQDMKMLDDIKNGLDIHRTVASKVWNLKPEDVTKELRTYAKRVVFGLMYGISIKGAANLVGCSENEAQRIQDTFFSLYPKAAAWLNNIPVVARSQGYLISVFGRVRRFNHLFGHPLDSIRSYADRLAKNFLMQSTVADITARSMINLYPYLKSVNARIVLTVHDSIIVQCDEAIAKEVSEEMMKIVTQPVSNYHGIIKCDIEVGTSWGHLNKVEFTDDYEALLQPPEELSINVDN